MFSNSILPTGQAPLKPLTPENVVHEIRSDQVPILDDNSQKFWKNIVKNELKTLEFEDKLKIHALSGHEIGDFEIKVNPVIFKRVDCFKVVARSNGVLDDAPCGTEITAYINEKLETIDQEYQEFIKLPHGKLDRKILFSLQNDDYVIQKTEINGSVTKKFNYKVRKTLMNGYVSESSNILLQRLMVQNNKYESITLFTFDSDMNPCQVTYKPLDNRIVAIDDAQIKVRGIERTVDSIADIPTTWQVYFSQDGHMINRVQIGYPAVMKVAVKPGPIEIEEFLKKPVIEKKELDWEKDLQLNSKYLDKKEELKNDYDQYMHDHPDLKALVADYTQSILSFKPSDTISFSAKFFAPYSANTRDNQFLPIHCEKINIPKHQHNHNN